jgi:hypothetical protein
LSAQIAAEFRDDGHSGARLDRPGLDALRDAAQAGLIERVWLCVPRTPSPYLSSTFPEGDLDITGPDGSQHDRLLWPSDSST